MEARLIRVASRWRGTLLVCGKCSRKLDGGFGDKGRMSLTKALRRAVEGGKGRKAAFGVVEVKCLGLCPKRAVTVVDAARPGEWLVVREGTAIEEVVGALGLSAPKILPRQGEVAPQASEEADAALST